MKHKIIETSISLFGQRGFKETSIQDIVDQLGLTKGTFYYYFKNKEEILVQIHEQFIDDLLEQQKRIMERDFSARDKLHALVTMMLRNIRTSVNSAMIFFREMRHLSEEKLAYVRKKRDLFQQNIEELVQEGIERGEFRKELRADMVSYMILGITNWSYFWYEPDGEVAEEQLADMYTTILLQGMEQRR
ncbi:TetR/AcrR family transcriptional regulator [Salimicrobium halophilum]|uniref:DNA-binding transcriptional regulator, AcrR family n=1 Tax=Salimicrobium halophilum TaxID=86666 RepID=A0A1G8U8N1_9BACI|nr:TetR/AcrR family transcriptional regulator [Salimicrobium halophilum]SDJ50071.1 DNA-binding transcriptional regulator, AcrR family [Salimicrobium halophilum]